MKKSIAILIAVTLILALVAACGGNEPEVIKDTSIVVMTPTGIDNLNPISNAPINLFYAQSVFDTLVKYNPDYTFGPRLAETWEYADGGMSMIFRIRQDAKFHDGSQVTAGDVVYSINAYLGTTFGMAWSRSILGAELVDANTVKVHRANREVNLLGLMAGLFFIVPEHLHSDESFDFDTNPVGSGPFIFESQGIDDSVVLLANEDYFLGAPEIKTLTLQPTVDMATAVIALQTGEVDIIFNIPAAQLSTIANDGNLTLKQEVGFSQETVILSGEPFVSNDKLRAAVFHGLSSENMLAIAGEGDGVVAQSIFSERLLGEFHADGFIGERFNPELARQLLAESGYDTSVPIMLTVLASYAPHAQVIQSDLREIGLIIEIEQVDGATFMGKLFGGDLAMMVSALGQATGSAFDLLNVFTTQGDMMNLYRVKCPALDVAALNVLEAADEASRAAAMQEALTHLIATNAIIPMYVANNNVAFSNRIVDVPAPFISTLAVNFGDLRLR